jgi:hypothetical protein
MILQAQSKSIISMTDALVPAVHAFGKTQGVGKAPWGWAFINYIELACVGQQLEN